MRTNGYNGWTNHATWNVALWLNNDEGLYRLTLDHVRQGGDYEALRDTLLELGATQNPDGVAYDDATLDLNELNEMLRELDQ